MALKKTTALDEDATPTGDHYIATVQDPTGAAKSVRSTQDQIVGYKVTTAGDTQYATGSRTLARLAIGTAGQVLTTNAGATAPEWQTPSGGGNPFRIIQSMPPSANAATIDYRAGGSTPAEQLMVWDFDDTTAEYMDFKCRLLGYNGGGLTFTIKWSSEDQTAGAVQWEIAIRAFPSDAEDIDDAHSYVFNTVSDTTASATGEFIYSTITFTDGADMDSWADGEGAIVRIRRNPAGTDTMTNDAELAGLYGKES